MPCFVLYTELHHKNKNLQWVWVNLEAELKSLYSNISLYKMVLKNRYVGYMYFLGIHCSRDKKKDCLSLGGPILQKGILQVFLAVIIIILISSDGAQKVI